MGASAPIILLMKMIFRKNPAFSSIYEHLLWLSRVNSTFPAEETMGGDNPGEVFAKTSDKGVKGVLPLRCLPHWGREGVTLTSVGE
jgi:hypothetical protein